MEKLVVMGGVGEDEMKGKHVLLTTIIYIYISFILILSLFLCFSYISIILFILFIFYGQVTM